MTIAYFTGFETGDGREVNTLNGTIGTSPVRSGAYALANTGTGTILTTGLAATTIAIRFYINFNAIAALPFCQIRETTSNNIIANFTLSSSHVRMLDTNTFLGTGTLDGSTTLTTGVWYRIDIAVDLAAGGVVKVNVDGVAEINTTHPTDATAHPVNRVDIAGRGSPNEWNFDDIRIDTGTTTLIGAGSVIARQPITGGTPTYDAWTKSSGSDAGALWDNTPFDTTDFCSEATAADAQTAVLSSFGSTQSGHGSETITSTATINASKIAIIGKTSSTSSDGADSIRRRVGGADTDVAVAVYTTSNAYRATAPFTGITYSDLTSASTEMGVVKGTGTNTHTVEDIWWMIDYVPGASVPTFYYWQMLAGFGNV